MRWKLFATFAETAGTSTPEVPVDTDQPTLRDALDALLASYPALEPDLLDENGQLHEHVRLLHDGRDPFHGGDGWQTAVESDDELALFPPVSGG